MAVTVNGDDFFTDFTALLRNQHSFPSAGASPLRSTRAHLGGKAPSTAAAPPSYGGPATVGFNFYTKAAGEDLNDAMATAWCTVFAPVAPRLVQIAAPCGSGAATGAGDAATPETIEANVGVDPSSGGAPAAVVGAITMQKPSLPSPPQSVVRESTPQGFASNNFGSPTSSDGASFHLVESPSPASRFFLDTATSAALSSSSPAASGFKELPLAPMGPTDIGGASADIAAATLQTISELREASLAGSAAAGGASNRQNHHDNLPAHATEIIERSIFAPSLHPPPHAFHSYSSDAHNAPRRNSVGSAVASRSLSVGTSAVLAGNSRTVHFAAPQWAPDPSDTVRRSGSASVDSHHGYGMATCLQRIAAAVDATVDEDVRAARRRVEAVNEAAAYSRTLRHDLSRVRWGQM